MTTKLYTTRNECISMEIEDALGEFVDDIDVERFADDFVKCDGGYYSLPLDPENFWAYLRDYIKPTQEDQEEQEDQEDKPYGITLVFSRRNDRCYLHIWTTTYWTAYGSGVRYDQIDKTMRQMAYSNVPCNAARKVIERYGFKLESIR